MSQQELRALLLDLTRYKGLQHAHAWTMNQLRSLELGETGVQSGTADYVNLEASPEEQIGCLQCQLAEQRQQWDKEQME